MPVRPLGFALDRSHTRPGESFAADADAVAYRLAVAENVIEECVRRIDDDSAGRLVASVADDLALQAWIDDLSVVVFIHRCGLDGLRFNLGLRGRGEEGKERFGFCNVARQRRCGDRRGNTE